VTDLRTGPKHPRSTVLTVEQEAIIVAFRSILCCPSMIALRFAGNDPSSDPFLVASLPGHGISRLPEVEGSSKPGRKKFERYPIGYFQVDLAEVRTAEGKLYLFVAIDRTSKFAFVELVDRADMQAAARFLQTLIAAVPYSDPYRAHRQRHPVRRSAEESQGTHRPLSRPSFEGSVVCTASTTASPSPIIPGRTGKSSA
jgi:hypothetical protein